jgi:polysaccharide transporter, PST family
LTNRADRYFEEHKPYAGLGRASARSGIVLVAVRGIGVAVQLATTVVLARLLSPYDFGLVAVVAALLAFAPSLIDLGTTDACTQRDRVTHGEVSVLFWLNVAIGAAFTLLFAAGSGVIASFFGESALTGIALASSLTFILTAVSVQHFALMRRAMEFWRLATIELVSNLIGSIVAIAMALTSWGYWALVAKPLITLTLIALGAWTSCPWLPGRPGITPGATAMIRFGLGTTGFTVTDTVVKSADRVAIGYFYGAGPVGYFQNAFLLYNSLLSVLTESLHNVAVSGLSKLRDDPEELRRSWSAALSTVSFVSAAAFAGLAVTGQDFVVLLLGAKWAPAGPLLCVFAMRGIAHGSERTLGWLHIVAGRSDRWARWGLFSAACQLAALAAGLPFGPIGVASAYAIVMFALFVPALAYSGRPLGVGVKDVLAATGPQTAAALCAVVIGLLLQHALMVDLAPLARLVLSALVCLVTYLAVAVGILRVTAPIRLAFSLLRELVLRQSPKTS